MAISCACETWAYSPDMLRTATDRRDPHHPYCDGAGQHINHPQHTAAQMVKKDALSLLVIDLGSHCVIKCEQGGTPSEFKRFPPHSGYKEGEPLITGNVWLDNRKFADLRAALEGDKPVPRLQRDEKGTLRLHLFQAWQGDELEIVSGDYNGLSDLAGHPLPIWSGSGEWTNLIDDCSCNFQLVPFGIWRYSR